MSFFEIETGTSWVLNSVFHPNHCD